jgi:hypothetical protein
MYCHVTFVSTPKQVKSNNSTMLQWWVYPCLCMQCRLAHCTAKCRARWAEVQQQAAVPLADHVHHSSYTDASHLAQPCSPLAGILPLPAMSSVPPVTYKRPLGSSAWPPYHLPKGSTASRDSTCTGCCRWCTMMALKALAYTPRQHQRWWVFVDCYRAQYSMLPAATLPWLW